MELIHHKIRLFVCCTGQSCHADIASVQVATQEIVPLLIHKYVWLCSLWHHRFHFYRSREGYDRSFIVSYDLWFHFLSPLTDNGSVRFLSGIVFFFVGYNTAACCAILTVKTQLKPGEKEVTQRQRAKDYVHTYIVAWFDS